MDILVQEKPTDRELLETIAHTVDRLEIHQITFENKVDRNFSTVHDRFSRLETQTDCIEGKVTLLKQIIDLLTVQIEGIKEAVGDMLTNQEERIGALETKDRPF